MQHDLRLIQLFLDLHNSVRLLWILIFLQILLQCREGHFTSLCIRPAAPRELGHELIHDLAEQLMRHQGGVLVIADDYAGAAFAAGVRVEGVGLLLDVLSLSWPGTFGDSFAEERHEFADARAGEAGVAGEIALGAEFDGGFAFIVEDLWTGEGC